MPARTNRSHEQQTNRGLGHNGCWMRKLEGLGDAPEDELAFVPPSR